MMGWMPSWQSDATTPPDELYRFAAGWCSNGIQIIGGCCGLSPQHIAALAELKI
jgi:S-methylmethionine-dependent homocysteine/selenocysteine methylase